MTNSRACSSIWYAAMPADWVRRSPSPRRASSWPCAPTRWRSAIAACARVLAHTLTLMLNRGVHPVIPSKGSVGASGDLAPLAHLALCVIGEGEAIYRGERMPGLAALQRAGIEPVRLEAKEGLALLNGTQALTAVGALALWRATRLAGLADVSGAMTLEALLGTPVAFDQRIHAARPHTGQGCVRRPPARAAGGQRRRSGAPHRARPRAGRVQPALHAPGARRGARRPAVRRQLCRNRDRIGHRQSAGVRRIGRRALRRQLPRSAALARLRYRRHRPHHSRRRSRSAASIAW